MTRLMLAAMTKRNRHQAMADLNDAIMATGGWVIDHTLFSNIATTFRAAVPQKQLASFFDSLDSLEIHVDEDGKRDIAALLAENRDGLSEMEISLNVTFIHDEPDIRREVPMVPG